MAISSELILLTFELRSTNTLVQVLNMDCILVSTVEIYQTPDVQNLSKITLVWQLLNTY